MPAMLGHQLLQIIHSRGADPVVAAAMRHAERYRILDPRDPTLAELNPAGMAAAEAFGRQITGFDHLRIFHSPVKRCQQTAECIARGAAAAGLPVEIVGPQVILGVAYITDQIETGKLSEIHGQDFVRRWFLGEVPLAFIRPAAEIANEKLAYFRARLGDPPARGRRLDLHVTHDWNVIILRELMLELHHEKEGWPEFLDGVTLTAHGDELRIGFRHHARQQPLPWKYYQRK